MNLLQPIYTGVNFVFLWCISCPKTRACGPSYDVLIIQSDMQDPPLFNSDTVHVYHTNIILRIKLTTS